MRTEPADCRPASGVASRASPAENSPSTRADIADQKAVIATVEPVHQLVARARIGGTIASLNSQGRRQRRGRRGARRRSPIQKLVLQMQALDSRIQSQQAQRDKAKTDFDRARNCSGAA